MKHSPFAKPQSDAPRIGDLSVLPIFLDLHGKLVCVIGDSDDAVWKAGLLRSAGARLKIISETPSPAMLQWISSEHAYEYEIRPWLPDDFTDAFAVVAEAESNEAQVLCAAARSRTSLINIVDKPEFCTFQFGSIVNRSPLVIGISTGGAAPVLAQTVRSRIESILPDAVQAVAAKAQRIRKRVNARLGDASARRNYWQAFFSRCFGGSRGKHRASVHDICVKFVEDLRVVDIRQLQMADRIECQPGVDPRILEFARREAERVELRAFPRAVMPECEDGRAVRIFSQRVDVM
jgi:uroporphyrin-III C-methyltransferase / precorrin-2 dehydrogenase / sirohydrochlorin ferrochelatase